MRTGAAPILLVQPATNGQQYYGGKVHMPVTGPDVAIIGYDLLTTDERDGLASDRHIVFGGAMVFIALLGLGFLYDWRKGVFRWR